jgi:hypothetical protein
MGARLKLEVGRSNQDVHQDTPEVLFSSWCHHVSHHEPALYVLHLQVLRLPIFKDKVIIN